MLSTHGLTVGVVVVSVANYSVNRRCLMPKFDEKAICPKCESGGLSFKEGATEAAIGGGV